MEVVVSTMLIAVVLLGALEMLGSAARSVQVAETQSTATRLAESLMAEVLAVAYSDPDASVAPEFGGETNEPVSPSTRVAFDDVDDYDGWTEQDTIAARDGTTNATLPGWTRHVEVTHVGWDDPTSTKTDNDDQGAKLITVTVTDPDGKQTRRYAVHSAAGALQQTFGVDTEVTTAVSIALEVDGEAYNAKTELRNYAVGP